MLAMNAPGRPWRVMIASITHAVGHGVAVVLALQAHALARSGVEVIVAGPMSGNDFPYPGCLRVELQGAQGAAEAAEHLDVDLIVAQTPPFFSLAGWPGGRDVMAYDHGEPPPHWFRDSAHRIRQLREKDQSLRLATAVYTNSEATAAESRTPVTGVIPLGNTHLGQWDDARMHRRLKVREALGCADRFVVLNVCRFHADERRYKGVETFAALHAAVQQRGEAGPGEIVFVQCGKATEDDVRAVRALGLVARPNVSDTELIDLYGAADAYANFSRWEGYNLGLGQALAMGLPTLASDIPAHRQFGIELTNDIDRAADWVLARWRERASFKRSARATPWAPHQERFVSVVTALCELARAKREAARV